MTNAKYEQQQLALIETQYRLRGYSVKPEGQVDGVGLRFDLVASKDNPQETIVVEVVNLQRRDGEAVVERAEQISRQFAGRTDVILDLRYLERPEERVTQARERAAASIVENSAAQGLQQLLIRRLTPLRLGPRDRSGAARALLADWAIFAQTVRAFSVVKDIGSELDSVETLYGLIQIRFQMLGAEQLTSEDEIRDVSELNEFVVEAMEGALVDVAYAKQLRFHLQCLRGWIKKL